MHPGHTTFQILAETQKMFESENVHPSQLRPRIIIMSMYNDMDCNQGRRNGELCEQNATRVAAKTSSDWEMKNRGIRAVPTNKIAERHSTKT